MSSRINVKFAPGEESHLDWGLVQDALGAFKLVAQTPPLRLFTVEVDEAEAEATLAYFQSLPCVVRASLDGVVEAEWVERYEVPLLPKVAEQWALQRMDVFPAHEYQKGDPSVVVAIVDTGLMEAHQEFTGRGIQGDSFDPVGSPWNTPHHYHGTACASCISPSYEGAHITAVAPNVTLFPVRASSGTASSFQISDLVTAISIATGYGADIISYSIGGSTEYVDLNEAFDDAIANGVLVVKSAGNNGEEGGAPSTPVREDFIAVGSINAQDRVSTFSSYGPTVDIVAPGEEIMVAGFPDGSTETDLYSKVNGTSFSCPHVAAICALVKSENPNLSNAEITDIVCSEVTPVSDPEFDTKFSKPGGIGCVNALKAVLRARATLPGESVLAFIRFIGDNVTKGFRSLDPPVENRGYFETNIETPVDAEVGVYGDSELIELYQGENFVYRGPSRASTKNVLCSNSAKVTPVKPA